MQHLFFRRWWQRDPIEHAASVHQMRYRFAVKHLNAKQIDDFFQCESAETERANPSMTGAQARVLASKGTLTDLVTTLERRQLDLGETVAAT